MPDTTLEQAPHIAVLADTGLGRYTILNLMSDQPSVLMGTAAQIWDLIECRTNFEGIVDRLHQAFDDDYKAIELQVSNFLHRLIKAGLLHYEPSRI